jgi:hypothetical protein
MLDYGLSSWLSPDAASTMPPTTASNASPETIHVLPLTPDRHSDSGEAA